MRIELRAATENDRDFVERVYFQTQRWILEELFGQRGDDIEKSKFAEFYEQASSQVILENGSRIGWWAVMRGADSIELGHIYLLPEHQRRGIGTFLIDELIREAALNNTMLTLSTAKINPAVSLYVRLGFVPVRETEFKVYFERR